MKLSLFAGLVLAISYASEGVCLDMASPSQPFSQGPSTVLSQQDANQDANMLDGFYLYGESPETEVLGKSYLLFEVDGGETVGSFYMPASEFGCFTGLVTAQKLDLMVRGPYDPTPYPYSLALQPATETVASSEGLSPSAVKIEGFHRIEQYSSLDQLSENDQRILKTCAGSLDAPSEI